MTGSAAMPTIGRDDVRRAGLRVGRGLAARAFGEAPGPVGVLETGAGPRIGVRGSGAQIAAPCAPGSRVGHQVVAVVDFPPRQFGPSMSQCLVAGFHDAQGRVALYVPDADVPPGTRLL